MSRVFLDETLGYLNDPTVKTVEKPQARRIEMPAAMEGRPTHHRVSQTLKHAWLIAWILATGNPLIWQMAKSQDSFFSRKQLQDQGVRFGSGLMLTRRDKRCINEQILLHNIRIVVLLTLLKLYTSPAFAEEAAR
jgi:hypothetical protein